MACSLSRTIITVPALLLFTALASLPALASAHGQTSPDHMTSDQSHIPTANIGNRQVALDLSTNPPSPLPSETVEMNLYLFDKSTNSAIRHVTFNVRIMDEAGKQVFVEVVHGHDGKVSIRFVNDASAQKYRIIANYDALSASYVSDFGNPIKVQGPVFVTPGNYKINVEVTGIDYDNTFLPEPVEYNFTLPIMPVQTLPVKYQDNTFQIGAYSRLTISGAELFTDKKQLVLHSTANNSTSGEDFTIRLEIPKEMMSGPFTASYLDGTEIVIEETPSDQSTTLVMTGKHSDMANSGSSDGSIVIAATNVVPEFPSGYVAMVVAAGILAAIAYVTAHGNKLGRLY